MKYQTYEREPIKTIDYETIQSVFAQAYENGLEVTKDGETAKYIQQLANVDKNQFGICGVFQKDKLIAFGDTDVRFSMQSCSKIIALALALELKGTHEVFQHVKAEPTGDSFNSLIRLDTSSNLPFNPMINAGAIQICSILANDLTFDDILSFTKEICHDEEIYLDEEIAHAEDKFGDRNKAIAYLLKSKDVLQSEPEKALDLYFKLCSIMVNAKDLAHLAYVLSNKGIDPYTNKQLIQPEYVRQVRSIMFTCGMYNYSGEYGVKVGIPSKSGVGGGIVAAPNYLCGIGLYGPSLDEYGNSVAGMKAMEHISHVLGWHAFESK